MATPTQQEIDMVMGAYDNAKAANEYAAKIVLEMQQNSGTDYKFIWTTEGE